MAVWNPHHLSYKLCRIFDSGRVTVDEFARFADMKPETVERLAKREYKIDPETRLRIGRVISDIYRRHPETRPAPPVMKLVTTDSPAVEKPQGTARGVFEDRDCFPGVRAFTVIASGGECMMRVEMASLLATEQFEQRLVQWLNRVDPVQKSLVAN